MADVMMMIKCSKMAKRLLEHAVFVQHKEF